MLTERITPAPHLRGLRTQPIRLILLHATRGGSASLATEYTGTKSWFRSPNNMARDSNGNSLGYGGCASKIIGPEGEYCIVLEDEEIPHYSAGYGGLGPPTEYLVDDYAISYEFAQPDNNWAFTDAQYERGAIEIAKDCRKHSIPPVMVDLRSQGYPVPTGITRHDTTANGVKLGKTDPGKMWNDGKFIVLLKRELGEEIGMKVIVARPSGRCFAVGLQGKRYIDDTEELGLYETLFGKAVETTDIAADAIPDAGTGHSGTWTVI